MIRSSLIISIIVALISICNGSHAQSESCATVTPIRFTPNTTSVIMRGGVARGEVQCFGLAARSGQEADVAISSVEQNAVFQLYRPGWKLTHDEGLLTVDGTSYAGAAEGDDATRWSGRLIGSGVNLLVVGTTRGGAAYELKIAIKP